MVLLLFSEWVRFYADAPVFPKSIVPDELPQHFCQFFNDKIKLLKEKLDSRQCNPPSFAFF